MNTNPSAPPPSDYDYYPPLATEASALPMAQLVSHYTPDQHAHQQALLEPLIERDSPNVAWVYEPPSDTEDEDRDSCCGKICRLFFFHLMNALLGVVAFILVAVGSTVSIVLLPLCCCGAVTCCIVFDIVRFCAQLDVELHNYISSRKDRVFTTTLEAYHSRAGERLAPNVMHLSTRSLMVILYFLTIKPVMSVISLVMFVVGLALTCVCLFVVAYPLMCMTAGLSRAAMRTFCCERFSTHGNGQIRVRVEVDVPSNGGHYGGKRKH